MKRLLAAGGLMAAALLLPGTASAQSGAARGKVLDDKGQPVPEARVLLEYTGGVTRKFDVKTNKKGEYNQVGMYPGSYRITISKDGFQGAYADVRIALGEATMLPDMRIEPIKSATAGAGGADPRAAEMRAAFEKANQLLKSGDDAGAEAALNEILAKDPNQAQVYLQLAILAEKKKDWATAEAHLQKALSLKSDFGDAYVELAKVYQNTNQGAKAMELLNKAATDNAGDANLQLNLGIFYLNSGQSAQARAAFEKALATDANLNEAHFHLGTVLVGENKAAEAVEHLEKYVASSPSNAQNLATAQALIAALKPKK